MTNNNVPSRSAVLAMLSLTAASAAFGQATTTVTRTTSYDYDATGQLIRQTVEPADPALRLITEFNRDATYGVINNRTLKWRDPVSSTDKTRVVESFVYDARKRFATAVTNAKSQTTAQSHDEATGNRISLTDANQLTMEWSYDGWGRKLSESRPDGTSTTWAYRQCVVDCLNGAVSVTVQRNWLGSTQTTQTTVPTEVFTDSLGREVLTRTWGFTGAEVLIERRYDTLGRLAQTALPRFDGSAAVWTYFDQDDLGRVTETREPNADGSGNNVSTASYNGLEITTTNAKTQTRTEVRNAVGALKSVTDAANKTTQYLYDPFGNLVRTTDPAGNQIKVSYDRLGRKTELADPDLGAWTYSVDPLGQTWRQIDAKNQQTDFTFDELGRMTQRIETDLKSYWVYDTATKGVGKLAEAYTLAGTTKDYQRTYVYDALSRLSSVSIGLDWDYTDRVLYDSFGRAYRHEYKRSARGQGAGGTGPYTALETSFNAYGFASQLASKGSDNSSKTVWTSLANDALGRNVKASMGNGLNRLRVFNAYTGRLERIAVGPNDGTGGATAVHQGDVYAYDAIGNLESRAHLVSSSGGSYTETFTYDSLNRLKTSTIGAATKSYNYDAIGNLTSKAGVGYNYPPQGAGSVRPHAHESLTGMIAGVTNPSFDYDSNGNLLLGLNRKYTWSSFNQAKEIDKLSGGNSVERTEFVFDTEHQRISQRVSPVSGGVKGSATRIVYYGGAIEKEIDTAANTTTIRTYLPAELGFVQETIAGTSVAATAEATRVPRYMLSDRLGSAVGVMDDGQVVLQRMSYDPWGRRRQASGADDTATGLGSIANLQDNTGYTGQEQLDQLALVHLNGRIYDPITARMLSADPTVPDPADLQALNRYTYVLNNALSYTDPSGFVPTPSPDKPGAPAEQPHVVDIREIQKSFCLSCTVVWRNPDGQSVAAQNLGRSDQKGAAEAAAEAKREGDQPIVVAVVFDEIGGGGGGGRRSSQVAPRGIDGRPIQQTPQDRLNNLREEREATAAKDERTFQTYTKTNAKTGEVYCGRTSGCGTALENVAGRDASHHIDKSFGPAVLDKSSTNAAAIRGREQQLIDANGGARSSGGTSGNAINGISQSNPKRGAYMDAARKEFGQ